MLATSWTGRRTVSRLGLPGAAVLLLITMAVSAASRSAAADWRGYGPDSWVTSWSASPQRAFGPFADHGLGHRTVRDIVVTSVGGDELRLELTNLYGTSPLRVGQLTVAVADPGAAVVPGTMNPVTYRGQASFQIPVGAQILSDPVAIRVWPLQQLAVSIYLPGAAPAATFHDDAEQVNWVSAAGDHAADVDAGAFTTAVPSWYFLSGLVIRSPGATGTVVAFGDSITDGVGSEVGANARWPNDLARRLDALDAAILAVTDAGIGGNRVLTSSASFGASAEARFGRDALDQPGVRAVIVCEGINDIGLSTSKRHPGTAISPASIIAGYRQLIARAHARGLRIFGGTLLPYAGAVYYTAAGEATREAVNAWIRTSGAFDGIIDFDAVMRAPGDPLRLNPGYDSGDHLHPNGAGDQAMAAAVNLDMLLRG